MIRIKLDNTWLTGDTSAAAYRTAMNVRIDGALVTQDVHNIGASDLLLLARGGGSTSLTFDVLEEFASDRAAQRAALLWRTDYPDSGTLTIYLGNATDGYEVLQAAQCVLTGVSPQLGGIALTRTFNLKCADISALDAIPGGESPVADIDGGAAFAPASGPAAAGTVDGGTFGDLFDALDTMAIDGGVAA